METVPDLVKHVVISHEWGMDGIMITTNDIISVVICDTDIP
jgi:hypothetical protein